uniref:Uncharacterized protein n=1 Tax=Chloropicon primus TaxID=1764295 RepID=A0A7S2SXQ1_9CHLO
MLKRGICLSNVFCAKFVLKVRAFFFSLGLAAVTVSRNVLQVNPKAIRSYSSRCFATTNQTSSGSLPNPVVAASTLSSAACWRLSNMFTTSLYFILISASVASSFDFLTQDFQGSLSSSSSSSLLLFPLPRPCLAVLSCLCLSLPSLVLVVLLLWQSNPHH